MNKKSLGIAVAIVLALVLGIIIFKQIPPDEYVPAEDEIALHILLKTNDDVGLLVFDYRADDFESTGGVSNANKSLMKRNSDIIQKWNKQELQSDADSVEMSLQIRIITEYVDPNFENIYPDELTKYTDYISWEAHFGESYYITITGDKINGYEAVLNQ